MIRIVYPKRTKIILMEYFKENNATGTYNLEDIVREIINRIEYGKIKWANSRNKHSIRRCIYDAIVGLEKAKVLKKFYDWKTKKTKVVIINNKNNNKEVV